MRDILVTSIVFGMLPFILRNPVIGIYGWAWLSLMNPHRAVYGFAKAIPFAHLVALATLVGFLMSRQRRPLPMTMVTFTLLAFLGWMTLTSFFAINQRDIVIERWVFVMKTQLMLLVMLMLVRGRVQVDRLIWVIVVSIAFYGVKGGVWTLATGGGGRVWGPPGMLEGNNELAVVLVMMVPLMAYLYQTATSKWLRAGVLFSIFATCFGILGSQSRGALLAVVAMAFLLALKSKRPLVMSMLIASVLLVSVAFMPASWTSRMDSIQSYNADGSAMSRIYTWKTLLNCALDRPLIGAGFSADNAMVFERYRPTGEEFAQFEGAIFVAHSIYLQTLGEHGFPGFILFIALGVAIWRGAGRLGKATRGDPDFGVWVPALMPMIQVSLVGFAVGGAFLSLAYLDVPYYLLALVIAVDASWRDHLALKAKGAKEAKEAGIATPLSGATPLGRTT